MPEPEGGMLVSSACNRRTSILIRRAGWDRRPIHAKYACILRRRAMYDDVVRQGVPDRFAELIRKLDVPEPTPQVGSAGDPEDGRE